MPTQQAPLVNQSPFESIKAATVADYQTHILKSDLIALLTKGALTRDHYIAYLRETFHLVRHTSRALALAASRVDDEQRSLRAWLLEQAHEEHGHELFCIKDLRNLGVPTDELAASQPGPGAWSMVTQNYFLATHGHPAGILGVASATEQMGAELAGALSMVVNSRLDIDSNALTFLRSHSSFDVRHLQEVEKAIDEHGCDESVRQRIVLARRYTFRHYGQMFKDVAESSATAEIALALAA